MPIYLIKFLGSTIVYVSILVKIFSSIIKKINRKIIGSFKKKNVLIKYANLIVIKAMSLNMKFVFYSNLSILHKLILKVNKLKSIYTYITIGFGAELST